MNKKKHFGLEGKKIVLVGATGILGKVYSHALAAEGAELVLMDHPNTDIVELASELSAHGIKMDLTDEAAIISSLSEAHGVLGDFDGLINNAAATGENLLKRGNAFESFEKFPLDAWKYGLDVNLTGTFLMCREAGTKMNKIGSSIINISSIYGINGPDHRIYENQEFKSMAVYSASKAGVIGLTKWLSTWWADQNIRVNCVTPGGIYNDHNKEFVEAYSQRTPLKRMAEREELVGIILFLLSDLSSYCTGQNYIVDGGYSTW
tara:strand:+ start:88 stop:876 length:789 start_codon:yes stop_codon:yes gene_type:complete